MQKWLQKWITQYVDGDPAHSSEETKARRPLAAAEVVDRGGSEQPGLLQLEVLPAAALPARRPDGVACGLVSKLPSTKSRLKLGVMAELTPKERLQPSLLDRLTDNEPDRRLEGRDLRVLSPQRLRESVRRDLTWLFNAVNLAAVRGSSEPPRGRALDAELRPAGSLGQDRRRAFTCPRSRSSSARRSGSSSRG